MKRMRVAEIAELLTARPVEPFGVYMSDRPAYPVKHPDQVILTPRAVHIGVSDNSRKGPVFQRVVICALTHATRLGPVPQARRKRRD